MLELELPEYFTFDYQIIDSIANFLSICYNIFLIWSDQTRELLMEPAWGGRDLLIMSGVMERITREYLSDYQR